MPGALQHLMQRSKERFYFPFLAVWNGSISISFFYFTGLLDTIGSSQSIPYMMAGTVIGSLFYPLLAAAWFGRSSRGVILSLPVAAIVFAAITLYVMYDLILNDAGTLLLSFLSPAGTLFSTSVYFNARSMPAGLLRPSLPVWLGGLLVSIVLFSAYLITFYRYMSLIILSSLVFCSLLLAASFLSDRKNGKK